MRILPFTRIKKAKETPTIGLPIRFFALDVLSNCLRPQDLQIYTRKSKFHIPIISPLQTKPNFQDNLAEKESSGLSAVFGIVLLFLILKQSVEWATCGESRHLILIKISKSAPSTHEKWTIQFTFTSVADPTSRPKQIKFGLLSDFLKTKKRDDHDVLNIYTQGTEQNAGTMHPTKGHLVFSSVIALFRFALTVLLLRNQHGLQIAKNLCTTHPHVAM